jgi:hypothetical protein
MTSPTGPTPGPWTYYSEEGYNFGVGNKDGRHVADVSHNANIPTEEKRANAHLIAAAPALLAALKELLDTADAVAFYDAPGRQESDEYEAAQEKARAAIKAAEGN